MNAQKVLIIGHQWVSPNASAAGTRMLQLIELFIASNYQVYFACAAQKNPFAFDFTDLNVTEINILLNDDSFDCLLQDLQPQMVVFDRFITEEQYGWRVAKTCPNAIRILDTEDLHFLRKARHQAVKESSILNNEDLFSETAFREIASVFRCDLTLIISKFEEDLLLQTFNISKNLLWYLPLFADCPGRVEQESLSDFETRKDVFFIGNFLHEPNWDAVLQLKNAIWPLVKKMLPEVSLHIYGAFASQKVTDLHNPTARFFIHGHAPNSDSVFLKHRLLLAPLRFGAGIKGKLLQSMQTGTPNVTTDIGIEGIANCESWNGFVQNNSEDFALAVKSLYHDKLTWLQAQQKGFKILKNNFDQVHFQDAFMAKIQEMLSAVKTIRQANFIGQMLQHQSLQSSKYMSLWIQEKNKKKLD
uniref:glycosyltransferase family 4 protein n=1 Tax=Flavobacterium sp. TaxID=239 RepID=UPI00404A1ABD